MTAPGMTRANRQPSVAICVLLADNLIRLRRARGWNQQQLAAAAGLNKGYVSKVEQALMNLSLASLESLAAGLDCWPGDLLMPVRHRSAPPTRSEPG
jgi:transcriptional regulator with XRE-family HTH domain